MKDIWRETLLEYLEDPFFELYGYSPDHKRFYEIHYQFYDSVDTLLWFIECKAIHGDTFFLRTVRKFLWFERTHKSCSLYMATNNERRKGSRELAS